MEQSMLHTSITTRSIVRAPEVLVCDCCERAIPQGEACSRLADQSGIYHYCQSCHSLPRRADTADILGIVATLILALAALFLIAMGVNPNLIP